MIIPYLFREVHIPSMIIAIVLGYQLCFYFLSQYYKERNENLELNKILLAYGLFFGILLSAFGVRILNNYYLTGELITEILNKSTVLIVVFSVLAFLIIISSPAFEELINPTIIKILLFSNLIPIICVFFVPLGSLLFQLCLLPNSFGLLYILVFQLRLINKASGIIKRRLLIIIIGEIFLGIGLALGGEETTIVLWEAQFQYMIAIWIAIAGLLVIFLGVFRFPAFLEFEWKANLLRLFIIDKEAKKGIYNYRFKNEELNSGTDGFEFEEKVDRKEILSEGILGINDIINRCSAKADENLESIHHGNFIILLQYSEAPLSNIAYALIVNKEMNSFKYFLNQIKLQFQGFYKELLLNLENLRGHESELFGSFDVIIDNLIN